MEKLNRKQIVEVNQEVDRFLESLPARNVVEEERPRRVKKHHEDKTIDVNINSLLDILSVILIFLMKSYSTTTVQVKPSPELQVPFTRSSTPPEDSTAITITRKFVLVDDEPAVALEDFKIPATDLESDGMLIKPLLAKLQEEVKHQKQIATYNQQAEFKGIASFIVDRFVPYPLLTQAMYTAGQAEYSKFRFVLIKLE